MAELNRLSAVFTVGASKAEPDDDVRTFSIALRAHRPGVAIDVIDWDDDMREHVENDFLADVVTPLAARMSSRCRLVRLRWHEIGERREEGYPVLREREVDVVGAAAFTGPPQQACSVTFETAARKRWGRIYWPHAPNLVGTGGGAMRLVAADVDLFANAFTTFFNSIWDLGSFWEIPQGAYPVIIQRVTLNDGLPGVEWSRVLGVRVDDVPDIIRSRRWKRALYRKVNALANQP